VPAHPRGFTFRDVPPEVAIICLPDSTWASRGGSAWASHDTLFGPGGPPKEARHEAYLDAIHLLTHGQVPRTGLTMHNQPYSALVNDIAEAISAANDPADYPYQDFHSGFCALNGLVVFDHTVTHQLEGIPLLICTGELLSPDTQAAITDSVTRGARCLALPHLLPQVAHGRGHDQPCLVQDGAGAYLFTDDLMSDAARAFIAPHLGPSDAVRYRFANFCVTMQPINGDERRLRVQVDRYE